jgi:hypothetical protein
MGPIGPIELQIIAIVTLFLVGILTIKDNRIRDILTIVPIGIIMMLLMKDTSTTNQRFMNQIIQSPSSSSSVDPLTMAITEYFQSQTRNHSMSFSSPAFTSAIVPAPAPPSTSILGPIQDLQSDPLFPSIASHIQTRVFLIKSPSPSPSSSSRGGYSLTPYNSMEPFLQSSLNEQVGSGMGLSTFFQNSYSTTPGTMWGATADEHGNHGIVLNSYPKQMIHDPKLTSLISTMIMRYPHRKNDLLEVSRRYHNEVLGKF